MDIRGEVKAAQNGIEIHLSGADAGKVDTAGLQNFLQSRAECLAANHCHTKDDAVRKGKCLANLVEHKFGGIPRAPGGAAVVHLAGDVHHLKAFATAERLDRAIANFAACRASNHCSPKQSPTEKMACINTLAKHILER